MTTLSAAHDASHRPHHHSARPRPGRSGRSPVGRLRPAAARAGDADADRHGRPSTVDDGETGRNVLFIDRRRADRRLRRDGLVHHARRARAVREAELAGPRLRDEGPHKHKKQAKAKARKKTRAQKQRAQGAPQALALGIRRVIDAVADAEGRVLARELVERPLEALERVRTRGSRRSARPRRPCRKISRSPPSTVSIPVHSRPSRREIAARDVPGCDEQHAIPLEPRDARRRSTVPSVLRRERHRLGEVLGQQVVGLEVVLVAGEEDREHRAAAMQEHERARHQPPAPVPCACVRRYLDSSAMPHRPLPKDADFPAARGADPRALARARRLQRVDAPPRGRAAVRLLRGPADGQRPARLPPRAGARVQGHLPALQDDARLLLLPQGRLGLPRPAGRDRRPEPARDREQGSRSRNTGSRSSTQKCRESRLRVPRGLDAADRADRLLGRPRRPLPHARHRLHRVGLVGAASSCGTRTCSTRASRSSRTARATARRCRQPRGLAGLQGRRGPERLRPLPGHQAGRRAARGRHAARVDDDALDAGLQRRGRRRPRAHLRALRRAARCWPRRSSRACSARTRWSPIASRARTWSAPATSRRSRSSRRPSTARRATPSCPATSCPPRTAPASSTPRSRSARTTSGSAPSTA